MSIFKCKMCGGALEINNNETVATCEYCGTQQTLPKLDDEKRANMYDRANHFRRNNEFDKAMGIYENILNEDNTDAEAYWSLVLCRYGIEYVEDPSSHKRIPTVNRAQFTSIFDDDNYKSALQYADGYQRNIYEEEAKAINEIQKGILAISQKEEPFDVFICYKETDNTSRRTPDSVLAQELYYQLVQEGFKVFFARITLEDKLGTAYEPYIFAALNSSKVMVALGTKPEHFNAVWVKNEWSRYLSLIKQGQNKVLIPAYKDMDPYDLPEEFSHLQAQDMSKLGFMQDLIRGIKKLAQTDETKTTVVKETIITGGANTNIAPLLKRAFMFLEDGEFEKADDFCEQVLNQDPENAQAYLGKLMAELQVKKQENLKDCAEPFDSNNNYQKALRFAGEELRKILTGYIEHINTRNENAHSESIYNQGTNDMNAAVSEYEYKKAAQLFAKIGGYKDADILCEHCLEKAEDARKYNIYKRAISKMEGKTLLTNIEYTLESAITDFQSISDYKDANELIILCQNKLEQLKATEKANRLERERLAKIARIEKEKRAKQTKKIVFIVTTIIAAIIAFIIILNSVIIPNGKYNDAVALMKAGKYTEAITAFKALDGYKDSKKKINECNTAILDGKYNDAMALMDAEKYNEAITAFKALNGHKDSIDNINECIYIQAVAYRNDKNWDKANPLFEQIKDYKDSKTLIHYHNHKLVDSKDATCTEGGYKQYKCDCGEEKTNTISTLGHDYSAVTCTAAKECSRCGKVEGVALGHLTTDTPTKCSRCDTILFKTLVYNGGYDTEIKGINLPKGKYKITLSSSTLTSGEHVGFVLWADTDGDKYKTKEVVNMLTIEDGDKTNSIVFSGTMNDGCFEHVYTNCEAKWKITIEAI